MIIPLFVPEEDLDCLEPNESCTEPFEDDEARVFHEKGR